MAISRIIIRRFASIKNLHFILVNFNEIFKITVTFFLSLIKYTENASFPSLAFFPYHAQETQCLQSNEFFLQTNREMLDSQNITVRCRMKLAA